MKRNSFHFPSFLYFLRWFAEMGVMADWCYFDSITIGFALCPDFSENYCIYHLNLGAIGGTCDGFQCNCYRWCPWSTYQSSCSRSTYEEHTLQNNYFFSCLPSLCHEFFPSSLCLVLFMSHLLNKISSKLWDQLNLSVLIKSATKKPTKAWPWIGLQGKSQYWYPLAFKLNLRIQKFELFYLILL